MSDLNTFLSNLDNDTRANMIKVAEALADNYDVVPSKLESVLPDVPYDTRASYLYKLRPLAGVASTGRGPLAQRHIAVQARYRKFREDVVALIASEFGKPATAEKPLVVTALPYTQGTESEVEYLVNRLRELCREGVIDGVSVDSSHKLVNYPIQASAA